jgi:tetratricopeptide (TPR) repeat protein
MIAVHAGTDPALLRREPQRKLAPAEQPNFFDTATDWLLTGLLLFAPFAFGSVEPWSEQIVIAAAGAIVLCLAIRLLARPGSRFEWSWSYVPIALWLLVVLLQLAPLPTGLIRAISPETVSLKSSLLHDVGADNSRITLTFYSLATRHDLRIVLVGIAVFATVINRCRQIADVRRLLVRIAIIGGAVAMLALLQDLTGTEKIFWTFPGIQPRATSGPFVHYNHYCQFMNVSMGAALGLMLMIIGERFPDGSRRAGRIGLWLRERSLRPTLWLAAFLVIGSATVFYSLSRGGIISLLIAVAITGAILVCRKGPGPRGQGWIIGLLAIVVGVCVIFMGFDAIYARLATLHNFNDRYQDRWQIVKDVAVAWRRFPVLGTGLGTHEVVYPMFDRSNLTALATHAENEYAQAAEETGAAGLTLELVFLGMIGWQYMRVLRHGGADARGAAVGLGFGLLAISIHSFSDFGQHLPANAILTATVCGLLVSLARMSRQPLKRVAAVPIPRNLSRLIFSRRILVMAATAIVFGWALRDADAARRANDEWEHVTPLAADLAKDGWEGSDDDFTDLISRAAMACEFEPGNVTYRHWLNVYRWYSISRARDAKSGDILLTPQTLNFARRIVGEFEEAHRVCPTFGPSWCVEGQLESVVLKQPSGADHIRTGYMLAHCDPTACFLAASLDAREGKWDRAMEESRRSMALGWRASDFVDLYVRQVNRPDLALELGRGNPDLMLEVATALEKRGDRGPLALQVRAEGTAAKKTALQTLCAGADAPPNALAGLAQIYLDELNYNAAADFYQRALVLDYQQVSWRLNLAHALARSGHTDQALHEAHVCLRLRPQMGEAEKLISQLSTRPGSISRQ